MKPVPGSIVVAPANGTTNVNITTLVEAVFATNLNSSTINDSTFYITRGTNKISGSRVYEDVNKKIIFTPANILSANTVYTAHCTTNIKTVNNTSLASNKKWWFKTIGPLSDPTNLTPAFSSTNAPLSSLQIKAVFKTNINSGTLNPSTYYVKPRGGVIISGYYSSSGKIIQFVPDSLLSQNTYYTAIVTTGLKSTNSTSLTNNYRWIFRTMRPLENPTNTFPAVNGTNAPLLSIQIRAAFRTNMNLTTLNASTFYVKPNHGTAISGYYSVAGKAVQFIPDTALSQNTYYTAVVTTGLKSTNSTSLTNSYKWVFKTLRPMENPTNISPGNSITNVGLINALIRAAFRTNVNPSTLNASTFYVKPRGGANLSGYYNAFGKAVQFQPDSRLSQNTWYTSCITSSLKFTNGTSMSNKYLWIFKTIPPLSGPTNTFPVTGSTNVPLVNIQLTAVFKTNIDSSTVNLSTFYLKPRTGPIISGSHSLAGKMIRFIPDRPLNQNTFYTTIITTDLKATNGSWLVSDYKWNFKTLRPLDDPTNILPGLNATNIPLINVQIKAIFRTNINGSTLNSSTFRLVSEGGNTVTGNYTALGRTITLTPADPLAHNTTYTSVISTNIKSTNGNALVADYKWSFRTMPCIPLPAIVQLSPLANVTNAGVGASPFIRFTNTYPVSAGTVNMLNMRVTNLTSPLKKIYGNVSFDGGQNKLTFTTSSTLDQGNWYRVIVTTNIKTTYGTSLLTNFSWEFKTTAPYPYDIASYSPTNSTTNVALNTIISVTFYTDIDGLTVSASTFYVQDTNGNALGGVRATAGKTVTFTPSGGTFDQDMTYTVTIPNKALKYSTGIYVVAGKTWAFKTAKPFSDPTNVSPANGATNISLTGTVIRASFVTNINTGTLLPSTFYVMTKEGYMVSGSLGAVSGNKVIQFSPSGLLSQNTYYTAVITTDLKSVYGTSVAYDYKWWFRTLPPIGLPSQIYPIPGQKNTPISIEIYARFNTALDPGTCTKDNFRLLKGDLPVNGDVTYDATEMKIKLQPKAALDSESTYTVILTKDVRTTTGVSMSSDYEWTFETGKILGKKGGKISSSDGILDLTVPLHALSENNVLTIDQLSCSDMTNIGANLKSTCLGYELGPVDYKLKKPVTIRINYSSLSLALFTEDKFTVFHGISGIWSRLGGTLDKTAHVITASSSKMGKFALVEDSNAYAEEFTIDKIELQPRVFSPRNFDSVTIAFELKKACQYSVRIFDMSERLVKVLCENKQGTYGNNSELWNGKDENGKLQPDGMFIVSIEIKDGSKKLVKVKPLVLMKK
ncbi:MAG: Ig-like domain-containing protein, partial [bacterium]|nr:Ig-like domain-containing protein [bacterium]